MAVIAASKPLLPPLAPARSIACSRVLVVKTPKATGTPVGMQPDAQYTIGEAQLEPGDILFGYSDGITDARNPAGKMFGEKNMLALLQKPAASAQELLLRVKTAVGEHIASADQYDDITMIAVRRLDT